MSTHKLGLTKTSERFRQFPGANPQLIRDATLLPPATVLDGELEGDEYILRSQVHIPILFPKRKLATGNSISENWKLEIGNSSSMNGTSLLQIQPFG